MRGRTAQQQRRQVQILSHPIRNALLLAVAWGAGFWLLAFRSLDPLVFAGLVPCSLLFGAAMILTLRRKQDRR